MQRKHITPRKDWLEQLTKDGVLWSTTEEGPYWNEAMQTPVYYEFTASEQNSLEQAANVIHKYSLTFLEWFFESASGEEKESIWGLFNIPVSIRQVIQDSWDNDEWGFYGRFDFIMTKNGPKLLEYNADTPTILIESAASQWNWFSDNQEAGKFSSSSYQFNEVHEALIQHWRDMKKYNGITKTLNFVATQQVDDFATISYLADTAHQAGIPVKVFDINEIQLGDDNNFYDLESQHMDLCFKLYPWEWMMEDEFGASIPKSRTRFIEPAWKMMLSNKALLVMLWKMFPECPYLVPAFSGKVDYALQKSEGYGTKWVSKPILSREGSNVTIFDVEDPNFTKIETSGPYSEEPTIIQQYIEWEPIDKCYPMLGVWMVGDDAVGLGIREDDSPITQNNSRFIPHVVVMD